MHGISTTLLDQTVELFSGNALAKGALHGVPPARAVHSGSFAHCLAHAWLCRYGEEPHAAPETGIMGSGLQEKGSPAVGQWILRAWSKLNNWATKRNAAQYLLQ